MPTATAPHPLFAAGIDGVDIRNPTDSAWILSAREIPSAGGDTVFCPPFVH